MGLDIKADLVLTARPYGSLVGVNLTKYQCQTKITLRQ